MGEVELPLVDADVHIEKAVDTMMEMRRSGLVTVQDGRYVVLTFAELVGQWREHGDRPLSQVVPSTTTVQHRAQRGLAHGVQTMLPRVSVDDIFSLVSTEDAEFGVHSLRSLGMMNVVTIAESLMTRMSGTPVLCKCRHTPDPHPYTREETVAQGNTCWKCNPTTKIVCGSGP
jgi:hypothetical protein